MFFRFFVACTFLSLSTSCKTYREVDSSPTWFSGHPSTSDDGLEWVFIEKHSSDVIVFPPLQGWTGRGNFRFRLMRGTGLNNAEPISRFYEGHALHAFHMNSAGYSVINYIVQPDEIRGGIVIDEDGSELLHVDTTQLSISGSFFMVPSPDAQKIAVIVRDTDWNSYQNGTYSNQVYVAFYDTQNFALQSSMIHTLEMGTNSNSLPPYAWKNDTTLLISDHNLFAWEIDTNNNISEVIVPKCLILPTSSGRFHADNGEYLTPNNTKDAVEVAPSFSLPLPLCE